MYLWDAVFAEGDDLVNYIVVSMLIEIRDQCKYAIFNFFLVIDSSNCMFFI